MSKLSMLTEKHPRKRFSSIKNSRSLLRHCAYVFGCVMTEESWLSVGNYVMMNWRWRSLIFSITSKRNVSEGNFGENLSTKLQLICSNIDDLSPFMSGGLLHVGETIEKCTHALKYQKSNHFTEWPLRYTSHHQALSRKKLPRWSVLYFVLTTGTTTGLYEDTPLLNRRRWYSRLDCSWWCQFRKTECRFTNPLFTAAGINHFGPLFLVKRGRSTGRRYEYVFICIPSRRAFWSRTFSGHVGFLPVEFFLRFVGTNGTNVRGAESIARMCKVETTLKDRLLFIVSNE